jgi:hypothetical protein
MKRTNNPSDPLALSPYLFVQYPPPNCGLIRQPPQFDGHPVLIPQDVVPQLARSRIGSASRMAFWSFVSHLKEDNCAALCGFCTLTLSGRAIGPANATAANSMAVRVVSCMVNEDRWLVGELFV